MRNLLVKCMPVLVHVNSYFDILVPYLDVFHAVFLTDIEQHFANFHVKIYAYVCLIFFASKKKLKSSSRKRLDLGYLVKGFRRNCLEISEIKITSKVFLQNDFKIPEHLLKLYLENSHVQNTNKNYFEDRYL